MTDSVKPTDDGVLESDKEEPRVDDAVGTGRGNVELRAYDGRLLGVVQRRDIEFVVGKMLDIANRYKSQDLGEMVTRHQTRFRQPKTNPMPFDLAPIEDEKTPITVEIEYEQLMQYFESAADDSEFVRKTKLLFRTNAEELIRMVPRCQQRTLMLQRLLESYDCALRAKMWRP